MQTSKLSLAALFAYLVASSALASSAWAGAPLHENGVYQFSDGTQMVSYRVQLDHLKIPSTEALVGKFVPASGGLSSVVAQAKAAEASTKRQHNLSVTLDGDPTLYTLHREVLVRFAGAFRAATVAKQIGATGYRMPSAGDPTTAVFIFAGPADALTGAEAALKVAGVTSAAPLLGTNANRHLCALPPNDPYYKNGTAWQLKNPDAAALPPGIDINVTPAWVKGYQGVGVTMAFLDDGVQKTHPDLLSNLITGFDFIPTLKSTDGLPGRHGTAVAGLMGAMGNNSKGSVGVAYRGKLMPLRIADAGPYSAGAPLVVGDFQHVRFGEVVDWRQAASGMTPVEMQGALFYSPAITVTNSSWTYSGVTGTQTGGADTVRLTFYPKDPLPIQTGVNDAGTKGRGGRGSLMVFAAGDDAAFGRNTNDSPLTNNVLSIPVGGLTYFGGYSGNNPGAGIVIGAPSEGFNSLGVTTTDWTGGAGFNTSAGDLANTSYTWNFNGTSAAAAVASGALGVLVSAKPSLGVRDIWDILAKTSKGPDFGIGTPLEAQQRITDGVTYHTSHNAGFGLIDLDAATTLAKTWKNLTADYNKEIDATDVTNLTIPAGGTTGLTKHFRVANGPRIRVEKVEILLTVEHPNPAALFVTLSSTHVPRRIVSRLQTSPVPPPALRQRPAAWSYSSVMHWGECAGGDWQLNILDVSGNAGKVTDVKLILHGGAGPRPTVIPEIADINMPPGQEYCAAYRGYQISAAGCPLTYLALGLPVGLICDTITGAISGTPYESGDFTVTMTARNEIGTSLPLVKTLHIEPRLTVPNITGGYLGVGTVGEPFVLQLQASGGVPSDGSATVPATWGAVADNDPGITLNPLTGLFSGTPEFAGTFHYNVTAVNRCGRNTIPIVIVVQEANRSIATGLDVPGQVFGIAPGSPDVWFWANEHYINDGDSVVSPIFSGRFKAGFNTTVQGPLTVAFDWMVSSHPDDHMNFYVDGVITNSVGGQTGWSHLSYDLPAGAHTLLWEYDNASAAFAGEDRGHIDHLQLIYPGLGAAIGWTATPVSSYGARPWTVDAGAAKSGAIGEDQTSGMDFAVTGPGTLKFDWKVSSALDEDFLSFSLDGNSTLVPAISGIDVATYTPVTVAIPAGTHTVRWTYSTLAGVVDGSDAGWVDNVVFTPAP